MKTMKIELLNAGFKADRVNAENAERYHVAKNYSIPILDKVVSEFENTLVNNAEFDKKGRAEIFCGPIFFNIQRGVSTSYKNASQALEQYVLDLTRAHDENTLRKGVFRKDGATHIDINDLMKTGSQYTFENSAYTINIDFDCLKPLNERGIISITPGRYSQLREENAEIYCIAKRQMMQLKKNILSPFKNALADISKYTDKNMPKRMETEIFEIDPFICMLQTIPRDNINYGKTFLELRNYLRMEDSPIIKGREAMDSSRIIDFYRSSLAKNTSSHLERKAEVLPIPNFDQVVYKNW